MVNRSGKNQALKGIMPETGQNFKIIFHFPLKIRTKQPKPAVGGALYPGHRLDFFKRNML